MKARGKMDKVHYYKVTAPEGKEWDEAIDKVMSSINTSQTKVEKIIPDKDSVIVLSDILKGASQP